MVNQINIRSLSFDTSFLLKNNKIVDDVIKLLKKDKVQCYITSTVVSELEQLISGSNSKTCSKKRGPFTFSISSGDKALLL